MYNFSIFVYCALPVPQDDLLLGSNCFLSQEPPWHSLLAAQDPDQINNDHSTLHTSHYKLGTASAHCTLHTAYFRIQTEHCQCTLHTARCTLNTKLLTLNSENCTH